MIEMNEHQDPLARFYHLLRDNLIREKGLTENSVLISFLRTQSASRYNALRKSTINSAFVPNNVLMLLLAKGFIQCIGNVDDYAITAKGVWHYEKNHDLINEQILLSYLDEKYFSDELSVKNVDLNDKEKVILFAMILARAFSEKSAVDLKRSDTVKDKWQEILETSYDALENLGFVTKLEKTDFLGTRGNEHVVSSIFRHNNSMVQKTKGIYAYTRKQEYYLDLYKDGVLSEEKLSYLFWKIFKGNIAPTSVDFIINCCDKVSSRESIYLFNMNEHIFSMPTYDTLLKDGLMDSIVSKDKWAKIS